jgi:hypothetical protein
MGKAEDIPCGRTPEAAQTVRTVDIYETRCKAEHPRLVAGRCPWCGRNVFGGTAEGVPTEPFVFDAHERTILQYLQSRGGRFTAEELLAELVRLDESFQGFKSRLASLLTKLVQAGYLHEVEEDGRRVYILYK